VKTERLLNAAVAILTGCALVVTALVVRRELATPRPASSAPMQIPSWRSFAQSGHRMGPAKAPVTIVVFSDFQCPYCAVLMERLQKVRSARPAEVAVVYRHFPVAGHAHAVAAARASECAGEQGRFEPFHDALFAAPPDSIGNVPWERYAEAAGVGDLSKFRECASATGPLTALARDTLAARKLYVNATPTMLINGLRVVGAPSMDSLEAYVGRALRSSAAAGS
jgi:protein-disulfide isomerase